MEQQDNKKELKRKHEDGDRDSKRQFLNQNKSEVNRVAAHYNARPDPGKEKRKESSVLIGNHIKGPNYSVLDIAGGKGGDLLKWVQAKVGHVVLIDVAHVSVQHALERFNTLRKKPFPAIFISGDCWKQGIIENVPKGISFDIVSCQFAMHYSFETEVQANAMMHNISCRLKPGGYFIATVPDANKIVKLLKEAKGLSFGNKVYMIEFPQKENFPKFGAKYIFTLEDSVDKCPEYLVHPQVLEELAAKYDMVVEKNTNFIKYYEHHRNHSEFRQLFSRMKVFNEQGTMSKDEWEAAELYAIFVLKKKGNFILPSDSINYGEPTNLSLNDIVIAK